MPFDGAITASEIGSYKPAIGHWRDFERRFGRLPDVHVGASLFHDMGRRERARPAVGLGQPARRASAASYRPDAGDRRSAAASATC